MGRRWAARTPPGIPCSLKVRGLEERQPRGSRLLGLASVLLEFGVHDFECGQEVAEEKDEERQRQHEHLPFSAFLVAGELKQCDGIVELPELERGSRLCSAHPSPLETQVGKSRGQGQAPSASAVNCS